MRHARRFVNVEMPPSGHRYRVFIPSTSYPWDIDSGLCFPIGKSDFPHGSSNIWDWVCDLAPLIILPPVQLWDLTEDRIGEYTSIPIAADYLEESEIILENDPRKEIVGQEHPLVHTYVEGTLRVNFDHRYVKYEDVRYDTVRGLRATVAYTRLVAHDLDGNPQDYILGYPIQGVPIKQYSHYAYNVDIRIEREISLELVAHLTSSNQSISYREWNPENGNVIAGWDSSYSIPTDYDPGSANFPRYVSGSYYSSTGEWKQYEYVGHVVPIYLTEEKIGATMSDTDPVYFELQRSFIDLGQAMMALRPRDSQYMATADAVNSFRLANINGLAYVKDLFALKELVESPIDLARNPMDPQKWMGIILWYKYGVKLSYLDTSEIIAILKSVKKITKSFRKYAQWRNSTMCQYGTYFENVESDRFTDVNHSAHARVVAQWKDPTPENKFWSVAALVEDLDLRLTLENIWDFVPYSFVVDWFVGIGDQIDRLDFQVECDRLRLRELVISSKNVGQSNYAEYLQSFGLVGKLTVETYSRDVSLAFPIPPLAPATNTAFLRHFWEGSLLFLQRVAG